MFNHKNSVDERLQTIESNINVSPWSHVTGAAVGTLDAAAAAALVGGGAILYDQYQDLKASHPNAVKDIRLNKWENIKFSDVKSAVQKYAKKRPLTTAAILAGSAAWGAMDYAIITKSARRNNDSKIGEAVRELRESHEAPGSDKSATGKAILGDWTDYVEARNASKQTSQIEK